MVEMLPCPVTRSAIIKAVVDGVPARKRGLYGRLVACLQGNEALRGAPQLVAKFD